MANKINFNTPLGTAKYPHLNKPDTAFDVEGKYKLELMFSASEAKPMMELINNSAKAEFGKSQYRVPYSVDDETGDVAFKASSKYQPAFVDTIGNPVPVNGLPKMGGGSKLKMQAYLNVYTVSGSKGVSITLQAIQIVEAVQGMNGAPTFEVVEGGFTVDPSAVYVDEGGQEDIRGADNFDF
jgi:hypothetical protein